jgi:hypothetical protein
MFKAIALALVLSAASLSIIANASAVPPKAPGWGNEHYMQERHDPTDTNGN